jgi:hypothetical protein
MVKKTAITIIGLYLFGVFGVMIGALAVNWQGDLPLQQQLSDAALTGFSWPHSVLARISQ